MQIPLHAERKYRREREVLSDAPSQRDDDAGKPGTIRTTSKKNWIYAVKSVVSTWGNSLHHVSIKRFTRLLKGGWVGWEDRFMTSSSRKQRLSAERCPSSAVAKHLPVPVALPAAARWCPRDGPATADVVCWTLCEMVPECILPGQHGTRDIRGGKA